MGGNIRNIIVDRSLAETLYWQICRNSNRGPFCGSRPDGWPSAGFNRVSLIYPEHGRAVPGTAQFCLNYLNWADYLSFSYNTQGDSFERFIEAHAALKEDSENNLESLKKIAQFCRDVTEEEKRELEKSREADIADQRRTQETPPPQTTSGTPPPPPPGDSPDTPTDKSEGSDEMVEAIGIGVAILFSLAAGLYLPVSNWLKKMRSGFSDGSDNESRKKRETLYERMERISKRSARLDNSEMQAWAIRDESEVVSRQLGEMDAREMPAPTPEELSKPEAKPPEAEETTPPESPPEPDVRPPKPMAERLMRIPTAEEMRLVKINAKLAADRIIHQLFLKSPKTAGLTPEEKIEIAHEAQEAWRALTGEQQMAFVDLAEEYEPGMLPKKFLDQFLGKNYSPELKRAENMTRALHESLVVPQLISIAQSTFPQKPYARIEGLSQKVLIELGRLAISEWSKLGSDEKAGFVSLSDARIAGELPTRFVIDFFRSHLIEWYRRKIDSKVTNELVLQQMVGEAVVLGYLGDEDHTNIVNDMLLTWKTLTIDEVRRHLDAADKNNFEGRLPQRLVSAYVKDRDRAKLWEAMAINSNYKTDAVATQLSGLKPILGHVEQDDRIAIANDAISKWGSLSAAEQLGYLTGEYYPIGGLPAKFLIEFLENDYDPRAWLVKAITNTANPSAVELQFKTVHRELLESLDRDINRPPAGQMAILKWRSLSIEDRMRFVGIVNGNGFRSDGGGLPKKFIVSYLNEWLARAFTSNMRRNAVFWQMLLTSERIQKNMQHPEQEKLTNDLIEKWGKLTMVEEAKFVDAQDSSLSSNLLAGRLPQLFVSAFIDEFFARGGGEGGNGGPKPSPPRGLPPPPPPPRPASGSGASAASAVRPQSPIMAGAAVFAGGVQPVGINAPMMFAPLMPPPVPAWI